MPLGLFSFQSAYETDWQLLAAASFIALRPGHRGVRLAATILRRRPHRWRGQRMITVDAGYPRRFAHALGSRVVSDHEQFRFGSWRSSIGCWICSTPIRRTSTSTSTARPSCSRTTSRSGPSRSRGSARAIEAGRILIGPWYVMPDEFLVTGESLVRNLVLGHRISRRFGTPMPVGYLPDLFGHVGQMPQIWRQFGLDNTILWRGFGGLNAEYWWDAPDGSRVLMMHLPPEGYCNATRIVFDPDAMMTRAAEKVDYERGRTRTGQALLMNGVDHVEPHAAIPALVDAAVVDRRSARHPFDAAAICRRGQERRRARTGRALETIVGELRGGTDYANLLPGVLSARVYLKQQNAHVQTLLESYAEPLAVFASLRRRSATRPASCAMRGRRCCRTIRTTASAAAASTPCTKKT